jgi:hypothetical protein
MKFTTTLAYGTVLAGLAAPTAFGQAADENAFNRNRYTAVLDRAQPGYDPISLRAGAFALDSSLTVGADYNDNVYGTAVNEVEDTYIHLRPQADFRSTWSRHALNFGFALDHREYLNEDSETVTDGDVHVGGRLDVQRNFFIGGQMSYARAHEMRYDPSSPNAAADPTRLDRFSVQVTPSYRAGRLLFDGNIGSVDTNYDDVRARPGSVTPIIDQDFRDVTESYYGGRASYAVSPDVAVFVQGRVADLQYDQRSTPSRDATRTTAQVGLNFELAAPFRGDIAVGYLEEDKDAPTVPDFDGLSVDGNLSWFPTQLTTVTFRGSRSVYDPGLLNVSTAALSLFSVRADHELRRNIVLFGEATFSRSEYQGIDRNDDITRLDAGLGYKMNRHMRLDFTYSRYDQSSSGVARGNDVEQNILAVGLRFFP